MRSIFVAVMAFVAMLIALPAAAETRVALVIGNNAYQHAPQLTNPVNDSAVIAQALRGVGFTTVEMKRDLGKAAMEQALRNFARQARGADVAVVYYAGHGMEQGGVNYLVPVDATLATDDDVDFEAIPLDLVLRTVEGATRLRLVILDACRNNPFLTTMKKTSGTRAIGRGLARVEPQGDILVAYAAREGSTADDGKGGNSPFAQAIAKRIGTPGLDVRLMLGQVRDDVRAATGRQQEPATYGSMGGQPFYFVPGQGGASPPVQVSAAPPPPEQRPAQVARAEPSRPAGPACTPARNVPSGGPADPLAAAMRGAGVACAPQSGGGAPSSSGSFGASQSPSLDTISFPEFDLEPGGCSVSGARAECVIFITTKRQMNWQLQSRTHFLDSNGGSIPTNWMMVGNESLSFGPGPDAFKVVKILPEVRTKVVFRLNLTVPPDQIQALAIALPGNQTQTLKPVPWN